MNKVKVCFKCEIYAPINTENKENQDLLNLFDGWHKGHKTGIIGIKELPRNYSVITFETRKESYEELKKSFLSILDN